MTEIQDNHLPKPVGSLCYTTSSSGAIEFACFLAGKPLEALLNSYHLMSNVHESELFRLIWSVKLTEIRRAKKTRSIPDIVTEIWDPVFSECSDLIKDVESESIKLKDVDRYFYQIKEEKHMYSNLANLFKAVEASNDRPLATTPAWIQDVVKRIQQYWSLHEQAQAANTLLKLKERLKLTGNFEIIQKVASQGSKSVKDDSLSSINQEVMEAKEFLEEISNDKKKLECLNSFAASMKLVEWIGQETTGELVFKLLVSSKHILVNT